MLNRPTVRKFLTLLVIATFCGFSVHAAAGVPGDWDSKKEIEKAMEGFATGMALGIPDCNFEKYRIRGLCMRSLTKTGLKIQHPLPVAFVEVVAGPTDSLLLPGDSPFRSGTRRTGNAYSNRQAFEVRIWTMSDKLRNYLSVFLARCAWCSNSQSQSTGRGSGIPYGDRFGGVGSKVMEALGCGPVDKATSEAMQEIHKGMKDSPIQLAYTSEVDSASWRTNCRDAFMSFMYSPLVLPVCGGEAVLGTTADGVESFSNRMDEYEVPGGQSMGALHRQMMRYREGIQKSNLCVGDWGPLLPRTYMAAGAPDSVGAALTAYRALHIARYAMKTFKWGVSTSGTWFQPIYPEVRECVKAGEPLRTASQEIAPDGMDRLSWNGRYGFIVWSQVSCCYAAKNVLSCYYQTDFDTSSLSLDGVFPQMPEIDGWLKDALDKGKEVKDQIDGAKDQFNDIKDDLGDGIKNAVGVGEEEEDDDGG